MSSAHQLYRRTRVQEQSDQRAYLYVPVSNAILYVSVRSSRGRQLVYGQAFSPGKASQSRLARCGATYNSSNIGTVPQVRDPPEWAKPPSGISLRQEVETSSSIMVVKILSSFSSDSAETIKAKRKEDRHYIMYQVDRLYTSVSRGVR